MGPLLTVEAALASVLAHVEPLPAEHIPLPDAAGRVLAEDVRAGVDLPPFPCSSMDGYAVRSGDLPGVLQVVGHVAAGVPENRELSADEAIEISTGGVVPRGSDAVVPIEQVTVRAGAVEIRGPLSREKTFALAEVTFAQGRASSSPARG